ncbi:flagellar protein FlgN [Desulfosporosinus sp.]|uniref:flagellar protein FlgN n=1 Tax=Desulfosporosinus sp. TaxID=157907 RepID=UPI0025BB73B7|nr:flagellar protein FlgN [Desulfosporosinus sp.]MBC2723264.1 flagellar protein FlgN [Desulfosporosinus sp.]MBC2727464.1 flagellar protein FlgN [Desulfosporosinus sp.]
MSEILRNLEDNLKCQVALYDELNTLGGHKQKALIKNNLQELEAITVREELLLLEGSRLEKERLLWAEQIGLDLGKAPEDLTLAELAEHYPNLQEVRKDLDRAVGALQGIHETNTQLLQQAMKVVEFTVGMLTHQEKNTYHHPTNLKEDEGIPKLHLLDRRV